jgi:hypothetical protein
MQVEKLKAKELLSSQKLSELRTKIRELEGEVRVREQSYTEHMIKIRKGEQQLVRAEVQIFTFNYSTYFLYDLFPAREFQSAHKIDTDSSRTATTSRTAAATKCLAKQQ